MIPLRVKLCKVNFIWAYSQMFMPSRTHYKHNWIPDKRSHNNHPENASLTSQCPLRDTSHRLAFSHCKHPHSFLSKLQESPLFLPSFLPFQIQAASLCLILSCFSSPLPFKLSLLLLLVLIAAGLALPPSLLLPFSPILPLSQPSVSVSFKVQAPAQPEVAIQPLSSHHLYGITRPF